MRRHAYKLASYGGWWVIEAYVLLAFVSGEIFQYSVNTEQNTTCHNTIRRTFHKILLII